MILRPIPSRKVVVFSENLITKRQFAGSQGNKSTSAGRAVITR